MCLYMEAEILSPAVRKLLKQFRDEADLDKAIA
jgi:hypothetical protein